MAKKMNAICIILAVLLIGISGLYIKEKISDSKDNDTQIEVNSGSDNVIATEANELGYTNIEDKVENENLTTVSVEQDKEDNSEFLNSNEGRTLKIKSFEFIKAYLVGDEEYIQNSLIEPDGKGDIYPFTFEHLGYMEFRFHSYDKDTQEAFVDYILAGDTSDSWDYLDITWKLVEGEWRVAWYGLEK